MSYFYTPLETSEKLWFSDIFRGYRNGMSACKSKAIRNRVYYLRILYIEFVKIQSNSSTLRIWDKIFKMQRNLRRMSERFIKYQTRRNFYWLWKVCVSSGKKNRSIPELDLLEASPFWNERLILFQCVDL